LTFLTPGDMFLDFLASLVMRHVSLFIPSDLSSVVLKTSENAPTQRSLRTQYDNLTCKTILQYRARNKKYRKNMEIKCKCSAVAEMGDRLATIDMSENWRGLCPFCEWGAGSHNVAWSQPYLHIQWHFDPSSRLATTTMGQK